MPQELLRDVVDHSDSSGAARRRLSILPVSIAAHAGLALAILIVPLTAEVRLPDPAPLARNIYVMRAAPIPAVPVVHSALHSTPSSHVPRDSVSIPFTAPSGIHPEPPVPVVEGAIPGPQVTSGFGVDVGLPAPVPDRVEAAPAPPPARHTPMRIGGTIRAPAKIVDVAPVYPVAAQMARLEGVVELEATIDERGRVEHVGVVHAAPLFDQAAMDAVRRWRFTPTLLNGVPVPVLMKVTVKFTLHR